MPIKRAKSKKKDAFDLLGLFFRKTNSKKIKIKKVCRELENDINHKLATVKSKQMPDEHSDDYWVKVVAFLDKGIISKVVSYKNNSKHWKKEFFKTCVERHEGNNYIKKR